MSYYYIVLLDHSEQISYCVVQVFISAAKLIMFDNVFVQFVFIIIEMARVRDETNKQTICICGLPIHICSFAITISSSRLPVSSGSLNIEQCLPLWA